MSTLRAIALTSLLFGGLTACSSSSAQSTEGSPLVQALPAGVTPPSSVPTSCSGDVYYEVDGSVLPTVCHDSGPVWLICDYNSFDYYYCSDPTPFNYVMWSPTVDAGPPFDAGEPNDATGLIQDAGLFDADTPHG